MNLVIIALLGSLNIFAAQCICQYPGPNSEYGKGYKKEILAYKAGCSLWLKKARNCRTKRIVNINNDLTTIINPLTEIVKLGFVGHWSGSSESVKFIDEVIRPIVETSNTSFEIDNTACRPMEDAMSIQRSIKNYSYSNNYITFKGAQTDSIGMWDKLTRILSRADLMAYADSRKTLKYPTCKSMLNKVCLGKIVMSQTGKCKDKVDMKSLSCKRSKFSKNIKIWKYTYN